MTIFGTLYFFFSYMEIIPQIIKIIKNKSSNDYSLVMLLIQFISLVSWTIYVFTTEQTFIVYFGTIIDLILLLITDYFILKYYNF